MFLLAIKTTKINFAITDNTDYVCSTPVTTPLYNVSRSHAICNNTRCFVCPFHRITRHCNDVGKDLTTPIVANIHSKLKSQLKGAQ